MADRPILFSAPMVRALLAGTKTQTRRVVKLPHMNPLGQWEPTRFGGPNGGRLRDGSTIPEQGGIWHTRTGDHLVSPYGQPGDRLWVRETFYCDHCFYPEGTPPSCYWDGPNPRAAHTPEQLAKERSDMLEAMYYRADCEPEFEAPEGPTPWRPSIHMPRWASRITLEVTGVRVERLQDISEADAMSEGAPPSHPSIDRISREYGYPDFPRSWYAQLWDHINGPGSWEANPWVWVVSFKRVTP